MHRLFFLNFYNRICEIFTFWADLCCRTFIYKALFPPSHAFTWSFFFFPFLSSKLFHHLCLPLPLSSPLFRGYVKRLRRPGRVGCRTEEAVTTLFYFHSPRRLQVQHPLTPLQLSMSGFSSIYEACERLHTQCCLNITAPLMAWTWPSNCCSFRQHCFVVAFLCVKRVWGCCFHVSTDECDSAVMSATWLCLNHAV